MTLLKLFWGAVSGIALTCFFFSSVPQFFSGAPNLPDMAQWRVWPALVGLALSLAIALNIPLRRIAWAVISVIISYTSATVGERYFVVFTRIFLGSLVTRYTC